MGTGSDWIRTIANFGRTRTRLDCDFFQNCRIRAGSGEKIYLFVVIILIISVILVVIRFHRFAKW